MSEMHKSLEIFRWRENQFEDISDDVGIEEPLEIRVGYPAESGREEKTISVTMRTPGDDAELAVGFLMSEGLIRSPREILKVWHRSPPDPKTGFRNVIRVELDGEHSFDFTNLERHFYTTSSCGVCGKTSIEALRVESQYAESIVESNWQVAADVLQQLPEFLKAQQPGFEVTGSLHGAGFFNPQGELLAVREDVGRHNAMDKLLGSLFVADDLPASGYGVIVSGRASFELVQKVIMAGVPLLVAVGAPSTLAVELAQEFGVTLVGFLQDKGFSVYCAPQRIK